MADTHHGSGRKLNMVSGTIRRLVQGHGFGFIASNGGRDIFFHYSKLEGVNFNLLREGQNVNYKIGLGSKGFEAMDIKISDKPTHSMVGL
jgi:CspA family cold shock protein